MHIKMNRFYLTNNVTIGYLKYNNKTFFTLEDAVRDNKISKETAIPNGCYEIVKRKVLSPKTKRYRDKYQWFDWHLMLKDVPEFEYIYIHIGNTIRDTEGCILVGRVSDLPNNRINNSTIAFEEIYNDISDALNNGEKVFIDVGNI